MKKDFRGHPPIESKGTMKDPNNVETGMPTSANPSMKIGLTIPTPKVTNNHQGQTTAEAFRNTKANQLGSTAKMISTYTGSNNMKLKIIDQSVIKGTMTSSSMTTSNISKEKT